jgi:hypothetical protein
MPRFSFFFSTVGFKFLEMVFALSLSVIFLFQRNECDALSCRVTSNVVEPECLCGWKLYVKGCCVEAMAHWRDEKAKVNFAYNIPCQDPRSFFLFFLSFSFSFEKKKLNLVFYENGVWV